LLLEAGGGGEADTGKICRAGDSDLRVAPATRRSAAATSGRRCSNVDGKPVTIGGGTGTGPAGIR